MLLFSKEGLKVIGKEFFKDLKELDEIFELSYIPVYANVDERSKRINSIVEKHKLRQLKQETLAFITDIPKNYNLEDLVEGKNLKPEILIKLLYYDLVNALYGFDDFSNLSKNLSKTTL